MLPDERPGGAGVVEVDVAQEQVADVLEIEAVLGEAARGSAVMEREAVLGLDEVAADDALGALVAEVD
jgi:hypothetical protein